MSAMAWLAIVVVGLAVFGLAWCLDRPKTEPQHRTERTLQEFLDRKHEARSSAAQANIAALFDQTVAKAEEESVRRISHAFYGVGGTPEAPTSTVRFVRHKEIGDA